jgi:hypothetical protein
MSDGRSHVEGKERSGLQHMSALDGEFVAPLQDSPLMPLTAIPSVLFGRRMRSRSISCCLVLLTPPPPLRTGSHTLGQYEHFAVVIS